MALLRTKKVAAGTGTAGKKLPPLPQGSRLSGNLKQIKAEGRKFYLKQSLLFDNVFRFRVFNVTAYVVNDPAGIEEVLINNRRNFIKGRSWGTTRLFGGNGLLTSEGDFWLRQRRLTQPAFHRGRLEGYGQVMADFTTRTVRGWHTGETRDIFQDMRQLTLEIVCKTLFDTDIEAEGRSVGTMVGAATAAFTRINNKTFRLPLRFPTPDNRRFQEAKNRLDQFLLDTIAQRKASGNRDKGDLLSTLVAVQDEDGTRMSEQQLRDEVLTLLMAGHETTAAALSWAFYLLAQHPQIEEELLSEIEEVLGGRTPTLADLSKLSLVAGVVKETLRLYPSFWITVRDVVQECEIGLYTIPAGARVCIMPWVVHHNPRYYPEPEVFRPQRWTEEFSTALPKLAYLPFGAGPRQCIGNNFALMEAQIVLTTILQHYKLTLVPGQVVEPARSVLMRPSNPIRVVLSSRIKN